LESKVEDPKAPKFPEEREVAEPFRFELTPSLWIRENIFRSLEKTSLIADSSRLSGWKSVASAGPSKSAAGHFADMESQM